MTRSHANTAAFTAVRARLRRWGMGARVLKTTLAVAVAWGLGTLVPGGSDHPYFAPLAALLSFQITVADSVTAAVQRILGIVAGVTVALVVSQVAGQTVWGVALLVFLALVVGANLRLSSQGVSQVATSALIVMFVGGAGNLGYAGARILESVVGAAVGVAVNALLVPPSYLPEARTAVRPLAGALAGALDALAATVTAGLPHEQAGACLAQARALGAPLATAQAALTQAGTSLKYNVLRRADAAELEHYRHLLATLEHTVFQVRSLARTLADISATVPAGGAGTVTGALGSVLATLFTGLARAVTHFGEQPGAGGSLPALRDALAAVTRDRDAVEAAARAHVPPLTPAEWMQVGAILAIADRLRTDLASAFPSDPG
ncbi:MAG TPA: FUSC family protein, partial [Chloroflexia bacterium]|nr:FUSC family protein [Chloroflexia bacterium]